MFSGDVLEDDEETWETVVSVRLVDRQNYENETGQDDVPWSF